MMEHDPILFFHLYKRRFGDKDMQLFTSWLQKCLQMLSSLQEAGLPHTIHVRNCYSGCASDKYVFCHLLCIIIFKFDLCECDTPRHRRIFESQCATWDIAIQYQVQKRKACQLTGLLLQKTTFTVCHVSLEFAVSNLSLR